MKPYQKIILFLTCCGLLMLSACSTANTTGASRTGSNTVTVSDLLDAAASTAAPETEATELPSESTKASVSTSVDVDLTALSSTMVYSEVYNMVNTPDDYIGKTVKMEGLYTSMYDEASGNYYFVCIIEDAAACCAQGIEFVLTDDYEYPADYPVEGGRVSVVGTFDTYYEGQYRYCTLRNAELA